MTSLIIAEDQNMLRQAMVQLINYMVILKF